MISKFHEIFIFISVVPYRSAQYYFVFGDFSRYKVNANCLWKIGSNIKLLHQLKSIVTNLCSNNPQVTGTSFECHFFANNGSHKNNTAVFLNSTLKLFKIISWTNVDVKSI